MCSISQQHVIVTGVIDNTMPNHNGYVMPKIVMLENGGYAVTWSTLGAEHDTNGVYVQIFDDNGNNVSDIIKVNTAFLKGTGYHAQQEITQLANGDIAITWCGVDSVSAHNPIFYQQLDLNGNKVGIEQQVNTTESGYQMLSNI